MGYGYALSAVTIEAYRDKDMKTHNMGSIYGPRKHHFQEKVKNDSGDNPSNGSELPH